jgi:hypothetical protein
MAAFLDISLCGLGEIDRQFIGEYRLQHQGAYGDSVKRRSTSTRQHSAVSQEALIFIFAAVKPEVSQVHFFWLLFCKTGFSPQRSKL